MYTVCLLGKLWYLKSQTKRLLTCAYRYCVFSDFSVNDAELKRLKDAFRRVSTASGFITELLFVREILWDGVPPKIAQVNTSLLIR